jgi:outer membrane lipoprotein SlyB
MSEAKEIIDKVKSLKMKSDSAALKKTKGTVVGGFIGMAGGLLIGYSRGYNLISSAFVGALLGGVVSNLLLPKIDE